MKGQYNTDSKVDFILDNESNYKIYMWIARIDEWTRI